MYLFLLHSLAQGGNFEALPDPVWMSGAGRWLCGSQAFGSEKLVDFLFDTEGLKNTRELAAGFVVSSHYYKQEHPFLCIGPLKGSQWEYLKTVTFLVNPDQFSALAIGAQYHAGRIDAAPVLAPFGSGCSQLINFPDLSAPQLIIGGTDIAMRQPLPPNILLFTVTRPIFSRLCSLEERSFLYKGFWACLCNARQASQGKR